MQDEYDLKKSVNALGRLEPIKKAADGEILDGYHRKDVDPSWEEEFSVILPQIKTVTQKILAKIGFNICRRNVPAEEKTQWLRDLKKANPDWDAKMIAERSGMSIDWVWKYLPEEFKDKAKMDAGRKGGLQRQAKQVLVPVMRKGQVCGYCGMGALYPTEVLRPDGEKMVLCMFCKKKYDKGEIMLTLRARVQIPPSPQRPEPFKETWEFRKARMSPMISDMERRIGSRLTKRRVKFESQKFFCLQGTIVDFFLMEKQLPVYLDGVVHKSGVQELKDETSRALYKKRYGKKPLAIPYSGVSKKEEDRIFKIIMDAIGEN